MSKAFLTYGFFIPGLLVALDQWSKYAIIKAFGQPQNICETNLNPGGFIEVGPIFDFSLVCNPGVSFSLLQQDSDIKRWGLTLFAFVMCAVLLYMLKQTKDLFGRLAISLIISGAVGNGIDRALNGAVTDFINVQGLFPFFPWVFNVADAAINMGIIALFLSLFLTRSEVAEP